MSDEVEHLPKQFWSRRMRIVGYSQTEKEQVRVMPLEDRVVIVHLVIESLPSEDSFLLVVYVSALGTTSGQADTAGAEVSEKC